MGSDTNNIDGFFVLEKPFTEVTMLPRLKRSIGNTGFQILYSSIHTLTRSHSVVTDGNGRVSNPI